MGGVARTLRPGGQAYVIVGDSQVDLSAGPIAGDVPIRRAAEGAGLLFVASASVDRGGRREHLLCFRKP